ncbi:MAG: hypothetical protein II278_08835 [Bacteroidaceae bacterium]|nr:hypothetical protein [Bacteroidaceae bacterium]
MREILFRGKRTASGEWVEGGFHSRFEKAFIIGISVLLRIDGTEVIPETVGQYTGLTDKNGKKIFEGDIVDASAAWWDAAGPAGHDSPIILVEWNDGLCGFEPFANYDCDCGVYISSSECEIIGNIHDNPELLKGK